MPRALICRGLGGPDALLIEDFATSAPGENELCIAVRASGLNFPDLLMSAGKYQLKPEMPFIPGFEAAGIVDAVGPGVMRYAVGDRVMVRQWWGCHTEMLVAPIDAVLPLPPGFSFEEGAAFMVATSTAVNAVMQRGQLQAGETLLVHGAAGGVGLAAVETGKLLGARVIATASSEAKLAMARSRGGARVFPNADAIQPRTGEPTCASSPPCRCGTGAMPDPPPGPPRRPASMR